MLTALQRAKRAGAKIVAVNPLPEAGLMAFMNPQEPVALLGKNTKLADLFPAGADQPGTNRGAGALQSTVVR